MGADEEKMNDPSFDSKRVRAIETKSNRIGAHDVMDSQHRRQSFTSARNNSCRDNRDDVVVRGRQMASNGAVPLQRCQSDFKLTMKPQKAINRNGTIARNQFRGIRRDVLESQTQRIIRSMTVSSIDRRRLYKC